MTENTKHTSMCLSASGQHFSTPCSNEPARLFMSFSEVLLEGGRRSVRFLNTCSKRRYGVMLCARLGARSCNV